MKRIKYYNEFVNEEISFGKIITGIALSALGFFKPFQASAQQFDDKLVKEITINLKSDINFKSKVDKCLQNSKDWWRNRLTSQKTRNRLQNFHSLTDEETDKYINDYLDLLNQIQIVSFDGDKLDKVYKTDEYSATAGMIVNTIGNKVFINYENCKDYSEKTLTNVISHEIQHLLDLILETTPYGYIKGIFTDHQVSDYKSVDGAQKISDQFNINKLEASEYEEKISELRDHFIEKLGKEYVEEEKEINARVRDMRDYFGKSVGEKITVDDIKTYVRESRDLDGADASLDLFLAHWSMLGYPDLENILQGLNSFTKGDEVTNRI